jgi:hypothetical protein
MDEGHDEERHDDERHNEENVDGGDERSAHKIHGRIEPQWRGPGAGHAQRNVRYLAPLGVIA